MKENIEKEFNKYITGINKRYMYRDKQYDERGIDYKHFIKLRLTTFDKEHNYIKEITSEGLHILFYLMTRGKNCTYIQCNLNMIIDNLNISRHKVLKGINLLISNNLLTFKHKNKEIKSIKDVSKNYHIIIRYHNDNVYELDKMNGFKAIPFDFIYRAVTDLTSDEFTCLMFFMVRHSYYSVLTYNNYETGEVSQTVKENEYAFPTQEQIHIVTGTKIETVRKITNSLEKKGYIEIIKDDTKQIKIDEFTGKSKLVNINHMYKVTLLNRKEYIYHHIVKVAEEQIKELDKRYQKIIKSMETKEFLIEYDKSNIITKIIREYVYVTSKYGINIIKNYKENY